MPRDNDEARYLRPRGGLLGLAQPARTQSLTMVEAPSPDPHFLFAGPNMAAARHIYDSLINRDAESRFIPGIIESWAMVEPQVWELRLRHGVTFHDGSPFTADDVAFSIARVPSIENNPGPYTSNLRTIERVEVVDPYTVRLHTDRPNPVLPGQLTNIRGVEALAENASTTTPTAAARRSAPGLSACRKRAGGRHDEMRNDAFWGDKAAYQRVDIRVIGNDASRPQRC